MKKELSTLIDKYIKEVGEFENPNSSVPTVEPSFVGFALWLRTGEFVEEPNDPVVQPPEPEV